MTTVSGSAVDPEDALVDSDDSLLMSTEDEEEEDDEITTGTGGTTATAGAGAAPLLASAAGQFCNNCLRRTFPCLPGVVEGVEGVLSSFSLGVVAPESDGGCEAVAVSTTVV